VLIERFAAVRGRRHESRIWHCGRGDFRKDKNYSLLWANGSTDRAKARRRAAGAPVRQVLRPATAFSALSTKGAPICFFHLS
jgi:hypothetical protein